MSEGNADQRLAWEQGVGATWVAHADEMDRRLAPVTALLVERAAPARGEWVLDVGCGTGALTSRLAELVGREGRVVGVDISAAMLGAARRAVPPGVELLHADAQDHMFPQAAFDLVVSRFGVMFFAEPVLAFRNVRRAMRGNAKLCFAAWAPLAENPHWELPLSIVARRLGSPEPKDPRAPGPLAFADEGYVRGILAAAGFQAIDSSRERLLLPGGSAQEEAAHGLTLGPAARLLDERQPDLDTRAAILGELAEAFRRYERGGRCAVPATVIIASAEA